MRADLTTPRHNQSTEMKKLTQEKIAIPTNDPLHPIQFIDWPDRAQLNDMYSVRTKPERLDVYWDIVNRRRHGETLEAIGRVHGISRERVRQVEWKFIRKCARFYQHTMMASKLG